jgi:LuxR family maltose regulon positive regulatory protein
MPGTLLTTKLHIPQVRAGGVRRSRLVGRLQQGLEKPLVLVSAPAGYGKTTLLCEWLAECGKPSAWVTLDPRDNDPVRFGSYLLGALQKAFSSLGKSLPEMLQKTDLPFSEGMVTDLINEVASLPEHIILILDDYQVIEDQVIHAGITFLVENAPEKFHLVIATRADPPLPLAKLRAYSQMLELRLVDLRFSIEEIAELLRDKMKLELSEEILKLLEFKTEGWIVGLQMAAISIQGRLKGQGQQGVSRFIETLTGSNRYILDYLMEEVIGQQTDGVRDFLYQTSVLDQMNASLCDALVGRGDSQTLLGQLEQANLFLISLDDERQWYRYHHLFAELLRKRLMRAWPERACELQKIAGKWYAEHNHLSEAIRYALEAGDYLLVNELVSQNALAVVDNAELLEVVRLFEAIPKQEIASKPWLGVAFAWTLMYAGRLQTAVLQMQNVEQRISVQEQLDGMDDRIQGHIEAIRANISLQEGHFDLAEKTARNALILLPEMDFMARGYATKTLGLALRFGHHFADAVQVLREAAEIYKVAGSNHLTIVALCDLGMVQYIQGKLRQCYATYLEAVRFAELHGQEKAGEFPAIGYVYVHMSILMYDLNRLEESLAYARKGVDLCRQWGSNEFIVDGYISLANALSAEGDWDNALEALQQAHHTALNLSDWYYNRWVVPAKVSIHFKMGDLMPAYSWLERWDNLADKTEKVYAPYLEKIRVNCLVAQDRLDQALEVARKGYEMCARSNEITHLIGFLALQAVILHLQHKDARALEVLEQALHLAEPEGYMRVFIDRGKPIYELLVQAYQHGIAPEYVEKLMAGFGPEIKGSTSVRHALVKGEETAEPLSSREMEVLRLLAEGRADKQIAEKLIIARETVHKHLKNIYGKLGVHSRTEAIALGRELGLI